MPFWAIYIEQAPETAGLLKRLQPVPGTKAEAQQAIDGWIAASGDVDPTHYRVVETVAVHTPVSRGEDFLV